MKACFRKPLNAGGSCIVAFRLATKHPVLARDAKQLHSIIWAMAFASVASSLQPDSFSKKCVSTSSGNFLCSLDCDSNCFNQAAELYGPAKRAVVDWHHKGQRKWNRAI